MPEEEEDDYDEEDPSMSKRQKTNNDYTGSHMTSMQQTVAVRENKQGWKNNLYSSFSVFGQQNKTALKQQEILKGNFHARIMHIMSEDLKFNMPLDMHFLSKIQSKEIAEKMTDEVGQVSYRGILIDKTRHLYMA